MHAISSNGCREKSFRDNSHVEHADSGAKDRSRARIASGNEYRDTLVTRTSSTALLILIYWKEIYPKVKMNQEKNVTVLLRDAAIHFESEEEVNTLRMQQSWRKRFTVLYFGNKI